MKTHATRIAVLALAGLAASASAHAATYDLWEKNGVFGHGESWNWNLPGNAINSLDDGTSAGASVARGCRRMRKLA